MIFMGNWKDNISFILVEPKEPGNVGASARAMKNMGFRKQKTRGEYNKKPQAYHWKIGSHSLGIENAPWVMLTG